MRVDLGCDPLFENQQSPVKELKQQERQRQKQLRKARMNPKVQKSNSNIQIIDPLPEQLQKYKHEIEYKKNFQSSKASQKLKKYIIQQERNLKCIRLQKVNLSQGGQTSRVRKSQLRLDGGSRVHSKQKQQKHKEINIPKIQEMFKNQQKEFILYQSRMMRNQLSKAINVIDEGVDKLKAYTFTGLYNSHHETKRNTTTDRFSNLSLNPSNLHTNASGFNSSQNKININLNNTVNQQDVQIDKIIEKKLLLSKKLRDKLYRQKKQMTSHQAKESSQRKSLNFFISVKQKPKKKVILQGAKSITFSQGGKTYHITPASSLLFSLNRMSHGRDKKQLELQGLIQNSYQNRQSILSQKSSFYQQKYDLVAKNPFEGIQSNTQKKKKPFSDFSPSKQFRLRQIMDKKLMHRLQLSKQQINKFISYLTQIKQYHVILNDTILQILKEVRLVLLSGKVMKASDLSQIIQNKPQNQLIGHPNELIIQKLFDMMI